MPKLPLTEEERKARRALRNKRYYEKRKQLAKSGDPKAVKEWERNVHSRRLASVKSFIKKNDDYNELVVLQDLVKERIKKLEKDLENKVNKQKGRTT